MTLTSPPPTTTANAVLATVSYSDVFDMPLEIERLHRFLVGRPANLDEVESTVAQLVSDGHLERVGDLVYLAGRAEVLAIHADRVGRAETMWHDAKTWGTRVAKLPFVRMVAVTGGLAVDSVAAHDDIDLFIITAPRRLWTARLATVILVRLAARRDVDLCPNYLISCDALEIDPQSTYAAREIAQMVPLAAPELLHTLRERNRWILDHLPNATTIDDHAVVNVPRSVLQQLVEPVLNLRIFDRLENLEMRRKVEKLKETASRRATVARPDESAFSTEFCKGHMVGNARGIEVAWRERLDGLIP